jgi:hypothetical protein
MVCWLGLAATLPAQAPSVHYWHQGVMPPGAIGSLQLQRGGPLPGYFQPVEIRAPRGTLVSLASDGQFERERPGPRTVGLLIGSVYRLRVTHIRLAEGMEVYPTIEVINRLYTPLGQERRFAIPVDVTEEDLRLALEDKFVTRVIYLEDPRTALPVRVPSSGQNWFDTGPGQDPLAVADGLGRPVAILRLGRRVPDQGPDPTFFFGSPPFVSCPPVPASLRSGPSRGALPAEQAPGPRELAAPAGPSAAEALPPPATAPFGAPESPTAPTESGR